MALPHPPPKQIHSALRFCSFARFCTASEVSPIRYTDASVYVTGTLCSHWLLHLDGAGACAVTTSLQSKPIPADLRARPHACALERAWEQWVLGDCGRSLGVRRPQDTCTCGRGGGNGRGGLAHIYYQTLEHNQCRSWNALNVPVLGLKGPKQALSPTLLIWEKRIPFKKNTIFNVYVCFASFQERFEAAHKNILGTKGDENEEIMVVDRSEGRTIQTLVRKSRLSAGGG